MKELLGYHRCEMSDIAASASVRAYDLEKRVATYDSDMEIMHPLRSKMAEAVLEVLPWAKTDPLRGVDLGVGTGLLAGRFLDAFKHASLVAVDGSAAMIDLCRSRIRSAANRVEFLVADFRTIPASRLAAGSVDVVFSAYALHHLTRKEKSNLIALSLGWLKPGGWFLNADLVVANHPQVERRLQSLREAGIVKRANGDPRFGTLPATRAYLADLERNEHDQPLTLQDDLETAREAGLESVEVFWKEHREAVWGGPKVQL
jgi:ubiquinone/menaquinone biosynthesis C-methylase UbiE